jgi:hypothetical protein
MDNQEKTRKAILLELGGKAFYRTYCEFNKHHDEEFKESKGYEKPVYKNYLK